MEPHSENHYDVTSVASSYHLNACGPDGNLNKILHTLYMYIEMRDSREELADIIVMQSRDGDIVNALFYTDAL